MRFIQTLPYNVRPGVWAIDISGWYITIFQREGYFEWFLDGTQRLLAKGHALDYQLAISASMDTFKEICNAYRRPDQECLPVEYYFGWQKPQTPRTYLRFRTIGI